MATLLQFFKMDIDTLGKIGVYSIHHSYDSSKIYVGSTSKLKKSNRKTHHGFYRRFYDHLRSLSLNAHHSKYLQAVVNKYGIDGLVFKIIEACDESLSRNQIAEREQYYINLLKPVYNSFDTVYPKGRLWTEEDKKKTSLRMKGKALSKTVYEKIKKPIYQMDMSNNLIKEYSSRKEAAEALNIDASSITNCTLGKRKSAGGYKWSYTRPEEAKKLGFSINRL